MFRQGIPFFGIGKIRPCSGTGNIVGQIVFVDVGPSIGLGNAGPGDAVQFFGLHGHFNVFPGKGHRNNTKFFQEPVARGEGKYPFALEVFNASDGLLCGEVTRIPGPAAKPGDIINF